MAKIKRALISLSDKTGIVEFAKELAGFGVEIISTGGTADMIRKGGVPVKDVSEITEFPEMMDGRVKTLHPRVHGGILAVRSNPEHMAQMKKHGIPEIDMVVVNLYPFEATISKPDCKFEDAIENIDIGGPTAIRSAAKNFSFVSVIVDPEDYSVVLKEMNENNGEVSVDTNRKLAGKVFVHTSRYDSLISQYLEKHDGNKGFAENITLQYEKVHDLRYGENPHQAGAFYKMAIPPVGSVSAAVRLQGKEMSFNNYLDANAALELAKEFKETTSVIVKHLNPCGVANNPNLLDAYNRARKTDPVSAFGGVLAFNRKVDLATAQEITGTFVEIVIAPGFDDDAIKEFTKKPNLRILDIGSIPDSVEQDIDFKCVVGGLVVHDRDLAMLEELKSLKVATNRKPTDEEYEALLFNWKVCKHVKSNAIILGKKGFTVGVGAGQMNRVDSVNLCKMKAQESLEGCVMASDAFFPFRDGVDAIASEGVTAVIQPGGSLRDNEVIEACNENDIAMVFSGMRHFRH